VSAAAGSGAEPPAEIEICAISTAKYGILLTSFLSNHENICSRNPAAYTAHFQINTGHYTGWPKKVSHYRESSLNRIKNRQRG